MLQYSVNKCVCSRRLKLSLPRSGSLKLSGREFQSDEPATEKARGPSVLSRHHGTTKRRQVADRRQIADWLIDWLTLLLSIQKARAAVREMRPAPTWQAHLLWTPLHVEWTHRVQWTLSRSRPAACQSIHNLALTMTVPRPVVSGTSSTAIRQRTVTVQSPIAFSLVMW